MPTGKPRRKYVKKVYTRRESPPNIRPHCSLERLTPLEFVALETDPKTCGVNLQGMGSLRSTLSLHPTLSIL